MNTNFDLHQLAEIVRTVVREETKHLATKEELFTLKSDVKSIKKGMSGMATKMDIKDMVRKSDIKDMVRQKDIHGMVKFADLMEFKDEMIQAFEDFRMKIWNLVDPLAGEVKIAREDREINIFKHEEFGERLVKLEKLHSSASHHLAV